MGKLNSFERIISRAAVATEEKEDPCWRSGYKKIAQKAKPQSPCFCKNYRKIVVKTGLKQQKHQLRLMKRVRFDFTMRLAQKSVINTVGSGRPMPYNHSQIYHHKQHLRSVS